MAAEGSGRGEAREGRNEDENQNHSIKSVSTSNHWHIIPIFYYNNNDIVKEISNGRQTRKVTAEGVKIERD